MPGADDRPDAWEMRPPTNRAIDPVMKQPQMPGGGILPPAIPAPGAPALPGMPGGTGGIAGGSDMLRQIMMMILAPQLRQFMGGGTGFGESKFTPGGPSIPGGEMPVTGGPVPENPLMRTMPMPGMGGRIGGPGYGINPPWGVGPHPAVIGWEQMMGGGNPIANAQGMQGNMQGPMAFLAPMMRALQQMQSGGGMSTQPVF